MTGGPHLWVPYPYVPGEAELCTLCGEFRTPENGAEICSEIIDDEMIEPDPTAADRLMVWTSTADLPEPPDGWDDEQRQV